MHNKMTLTVLVLINHMQSFNRSFCFRVLEECSVSRRATLFPVFYFTCSWNVNHHMVNTTLLRDSWCLSTDLINIVCSIWRPAYKFYVVHNMIPVGTLCHYETEWHWWLVFALIYLASCMGGQSEATLWLGAHSGLLAVPCKKIARVSFP